MPCYDSRDHGHTTIEVDRRVNGCTAAQLDAILCGVLDVDRDKLKKGVLVWDLVDWDEVGVSRATAEMWHRNHREADRKKRERQLREKTLNDLKKSALSKLTPEEINAIKRKGV